MENDFGFVREVFNLCCKINNLSFWHGIHKRNLNPLNSIKRAVISHYYEKDMQIARNKKCLFSSLNTLVGELATHHYMLYKPFRKAGLFSDSSSRNKFIKALLNTNSYLQQCKMCSLNYYNLLLHQLTACPKLTCERNTLRKMLILYGTNPNPQLTNLTLLVSETLVNKNILRAFTDFLVSSSY